MAITGSLEYMASQTTGQDDSAIGGYLDTYRNRTLYLRNVMEFWEFEQELAAIDDLPQCLLRRAFEGQL